MDAWSRKQYAEAEAMLDEAEAILDEIWHEESKAFANRPVRLQRAEEGAVEEARLNGIEDLIQQIAEARETLIALSFSPPPRPQPTPLKTSRPIRSAAGAHCHCCAKCRSHGGRTNPWDSEKTFVVPGRRGKGPSE
jgi:hypothetical protein